MRVWGDDHNEVSGRDMAVPKINFVREAQEVGGYMQSDELGMSPEIAGLGKSLKKVAKKVKKPALIAAAGVATVATGGAAAPLLLATVNYALKKKGAMGGVPASLPAEYLGAGELQQAMGGGGPQQEPGPQGDGGGLSSLIRNPVVLAGAAVAGLGLFFALRK